MIITQELDRLVRTLWDLIERHEIVRHRIDNVKDVVKYVIYACNNTNYRSLNNKTSNEIFNDLPLKMAKNVNYSTRNKIKIQITSFQSW